MKVSVAIEQGIFEKPCNKCNSVKKLTEFSLQMKDKPEERYHSWCRTCTRSNCKKYEIDNKEIVLQRDRLRWHKNKDRINAVRRERYNTEEEYRLGVLERNRAGYSCSPEAKKSYRKRYYRLFSDRESAREAVKVFLKAGTLTKTKTCQGIGCTQRAPVLQGHHIDYSRLVDVMWLCTASHGKWHREHKLGIVILERLENLTDDDIRKELANPSGGGPHIAQLEKTLMGLTIIYLNLAKGLSDAIYVSYVQRLPDAKGVGITKHLIQRP